MLASPSNVPLADLMAAGLGAPGRTVTAVLAVLLTMGTMNTYVAAATKLAGTMAPPKVARRPLAWFALVAAALLVPLAFEVLSLDGLMRASSAAFVAVYVTATAAGVRLLSGAARASAAVALAAVLVVFAFSGPYVLVPVLISCALRIAATDDHAPPSFARTRHHIRLVGSVLVVNCEPATVSLAVSGAENDWESSIWIV